MENESPDNPYHSPAHSAASGLPWSEMRETRIPQTLGVLNIVFGGILILSHLCCDGYTLFYAAVMPQMMSAGIQQSQQQMKQLEDQQLQAELDALDEQIKAAPTEAEKAALQAERDLVKMRPRVSAPDPTPIFKSMSNPQLIAIYAIHLALGLIFNAVLITAGIGLLKPARWGRVWSLRVAIAKIIGAVALNGWLLALAPVLSQSVVKALQEMTANQPGAMPPQQLDTLVMVYTVMGCVYAAVVMIVSCIYPIVSLILLRKKHVIEACDRGPVAAATP